MRRIIIDTDTASDDAIALIMALRTPDIDVEAITIVSGNVAVRQGAINAGIVLDLCEADVPIHLGADRPLIHKRADAGYFHGADGLGDVEFPAPRRTAAAGHAVLELIRRFGAAPGEIDLVTLGPLTNIALALRIAPEFASWVRRCTIMGGNPLGVGNVTPAAEYNIWCDPHAASIVIDSGMNITLVGWELSRGPACLNLAEIALLENAPSPAARFAIACSRTALRASIETQGEPGLPLPDPVAMAVALDPGVATARTRAAIAVPLDGLARGATLVDRLHVSGSGSTDPAWTAPLPMIDIVEAIDIERFKTLLRARLEP